jgi:glycosyltransferase involved in cell wall biosynthesis
MNISVCIATYNGEKFILEQINSILPQLDKDDEVIISDDCSTDNTIELIKSLNDNRIRIYINKKQIGIIANFENAIRIAKGNYIFLSDQDDIWKPDKVQVQLSDLVDKGFDLSISDCEIFDSNTGLTIENSFFQFNKVNYSKLRNLFKNSFMGCCVVFKSTLKSKILPFPPKLPMHDWWIGLVALTFYKVNFNSEILVKYRKHNNFSFTARGKSDNSFKQKSLFRIKILFSLISRSIKLFSFDDKK